MSSLAEESEDGAESDVPALDENISLETTRPGDRDTPEGFSGLLDLSLEDAYADGDEVESNGLASHDSDTHQYSDADSLHGDSSSGLRSRLGRAESPGQSPSIPDDTPSIQVSNRLP